MTQFIRLTCEPNQNVIAVIVNAAMADMRATPEYQAWIAGQAADEPNRAERVAKDIGMRVKRAKQGNTQRFACDATRANLGKSYIVVMDEFYDVPSYKPSEWLKDVQI